MKVYPSRFQLHFVIIAAAASVIESSGVGSARVWEGVNGVVANLTGGEAITACRRTARGTQARVAIACTIYDARS
jgi:hypothetical protein